MPWTMLSTREILRRICSLSCSPAFISEVAPPFVLYAISEADCKVAPHSLTWIDKADYPKGNWCKRRKSWLPGGRTCGINKIVITFFFCFARGTRIRGHQIASACCGRLHWLCEGLGLFFLRCEYKSAEYFLFLECIFLLVCEVSK